MPDRQMAPPPRFVPASDGILQFASWSCPACAGAGSGERLTGLDDTAEDVRAEAIEHIKVTGHQVEFRRGTVEGLHGYATVAEFCGCPGDTHRPPCPHAGEE